eukprot:GHVO01039259.1.p1 GENE.GHVO01039259.1~~GHVO01039259.1.p1  ORF type:complete len:105 (+),score=11.65 GHVO01039259.1:139-453(+)
MLQSVVKTSLLPLAATKPTYLGIKKENLPVFRQKIRLHKKKARPTSSDGPINQPSFLQSQASLGAASSSPKDKIMEELTESASPQVNVQLVVRPPVVIRCMLRM